MYKIKRVVVNTDKHVRNKKEMQEIKKKLAEITGATTGAIYMTFEETIK